MHLDNALRWDIDAVTVLRLAGPTTHSVVETIMTSLLSEEYMLLQIDAIKVA